MFQNQKVQVIKILKKKMYIFGQNSHFLFLCFFSCFFMYYILFINNMIFGPPKPKILSCFSYKKS